MDAEKRKRTEYEYHHERLQGCRGVLTNPAVVFLVAGLLTSCLCLTLSLAVFPKGFSVDSLNALISTLRPGSSPVIVGAFPTPVFTPTPIATAPYTPDAQPGQTQAALANTQTAIPKTQVALAATLTQMVVPTRTAVTLTPDSAATATSEAATRTAFAVPLQSGTPVLPYSIRSEQTGTGKQVQYTVVLGANEALVGTAVALLGNSGTCVVFVAIGPGTVTFQISDGSWDQYASILSPRDIDYLLDKWFRFASQSCTPDHPEVTLEVE